MKKRAKSTQQFNLTQQAVLAAIICGAFNQAQALPMGEQVQAGSINFVRDGQSLNINQFSQKAIVNWQSFDITANEAVRLNQPNQGSALFRVLGSDPSQIFGSLTATGRLFLINPNGVLFGRGARVDVGGLVATTMRMNDADFLSGNYRFFTNPNDPLGASVVNQGVIRATDGGYLVLLGETVENSGTLEANRGSVVLGSAQSAMLDFYGDGLVRVKLDGDALKAAINNTGSIHADGGAVQLATNARTAAINVDGVIQANSLVNRNGVIRLEGGKNAKVSVSGTLSAASNEAGTTGGRVEVTGEQVALFKGAKLDASGDAGGGTALVGGDYQGKSTQVYNSRTTYVDKDTSINVDAKNNGNGGKAIVWANEVTRYYGSISAKGGKNSGNGGFAEVSGKRLLNFLGKADLSADNGLGGSLLLDPLNIALTTVDANTAGFTPLGDITEAFADDAGLTSTFNVNAGGSFNGISAGSTITLQATNDITVSSAFNLATATGSANNSLVLQANNNINVNAAVTTTGTGAITMNANADNVGGGNLAIGANNIASQAGGITLSGANITKTTGTIVSTGAASANAGNINISATNTANLGAGAIAANGGAGAAATAGGNAGNISITAAGAITTGAVTATGGAAGAGNAAGGNAGTINISTTVGNITTGALAAQTGAATGTGAGGTAGSITVNNTAAVGNITLGALTTTGGANGNSGSINASATGLLTLNGAIAANGGANVAATTQAGKNAGNVTLIGNAGVTNAAAATINANGSAGFGANQAGGNAGVVSLASSAGAISARAINAQTGAATGTGAGGAVGSITLSGSSITTNAGALTTTGGANGNGGNINLSTSSGSLAAGAMNSSGGTALAGTTGRNAGNITLNAANTITTTTFTANGTAGTLAGDQAGGNGGVIAITGINGVTTTTIAANGGAAAGTNANGGNAGSINIANSGTGNITTGALAARAGAGLGTGADSIQGFVTVNNTSAAGTVNTGAIDTSGQANGHGGNVSLAGNNAVTVTGALNTNGGAATGTRAGRNAGNVTITGVNRSVTGAITANGNAAIGAAQTGGNAGLVSITGAGTLNTAAINAQTGSATTTGAGGTVGGITLNGTSVTTGALSTTGGVNGRGGAISATSTTGNLVTGAVTSSGGGSNASTSGNAAGNINLTSAASLSTTGVISAIGSTGGSLNQGGGNAGNVTINANTGISITGVLAADGGNGFAGSTLASAGDAGTVIITNSSTGNISTSTLSAIAGQAFGTGTAGIAKSITVTNTATAGNVTTSTIRTTGGINAHGGNVSVSSQGDITTSTITTSAGALGTGSVNTGRNAGTVALTAGGNITASTIAATGGAGLGGNQNGGNGGAVTLDAGVGSNITMANISTNGGVRTGAGVGGTGGNITVADNALLSANTIIDASGGSGVGTSGTVNFGGTINSLGANRTLTINTTAATTFTGAVGDSLALASLATNAGGTTAINGGVVTTTGVQTYNDNVTLGAATTLTTTNSNVTFTAASSAVNAAGNNLTIAAGTGAVAATNAANNFANLAIRAGSANIRDTDAIVLGASNVTGAYALQTNGAITQTAGVTVGGATTLNAGAANDITLNNAANNFNTVAVTSGRDVNLVDTNTLTVNASTVRKVTAQTLSGDLTLGGAITATGTGSGTSINLVSAGNFLNPGNSALTAGAGSRWLVYSTNPTLDARGAGLLAAYNFKQYNTAFGGPILGTGNGFIYSVAPTITGILTGSATKTYNGTIAAPSGSLVLSNTGAIDGDSIVLDGLSSTTYDTANAGTGKTVSANGISLTSANNAGKAVYGYQLASTTATGAVGTINKANLTVSTSNVTKTYDGTLTAVGTATVTSGTLFNNASNGGALDSLSGGTFAYTNANAGTGKTVTVGGVTVNDGNGDGNYNVTFANNTTSTINKANITVSTSDVVKTYDGTLSAAGVANVTSGTLFNNISNGGAADTLSGGTFAYTDKNFGIGNKTVTVGGVAVSDGNGGGNYNVTFANNTTSTINKANLAIDAVADTKTYDGIITSAGVVNVGTLFGTDTVTGAVQAFASKNALGVNGSTLNVTGFALNDGNGGNNYTVTTNAAAGTINPRAITVTSATDTKTYDGTTSSLGAPTVTFGSIVAGDAGNFNQTFDNRNAGTGKILTSIGSVTDGNGGNNYAVTFVADNTGVINQANLTVTAQTDSRVYDGTTTSAVAPVVTGTLFDTIGTAATQGYDNRNAGAGKTLTASGLVVNDGNGGNNYAVNYVNNNTGVITKANLTVTAQTDNRVYDGTTNSAAAPVITGTLFDAIGTAAIQSYDNRNAGTGKTLTANGLAVNDGNGGNNYAVNYVNNNTGVITPRAITVTSSTDTKTYDGTTSSAAAPTVTLGSIVAGDSGSFNQTFDNKNAGTGKTLTSAGGVTDGNGGNNYAVTFIADNTGVINQRALTVTANSGQSKVFGAVDPLPFNFSIGGLGLVAGDSLTGALDRVSGETVGSYAINQGTLAASPNYLFTYIGNNFSIFAPTVSGGGSNDPRSAAGLVDLNPALGNYTNQQLFVLNVGFTAAGSDSANQEACEGEPEKLAKDKDFILMLNYGLKLPKGVNASCDKHSGDKT